VYDKSFELLDKFNIVVPTTTRYEFSFTSAMGMTLKDASEPSPLFWVYGEGLLLKRDSSVSEWVSGGEFIGWSHIVSEKLPYQALMDSLDYSSDLKTWLVLADTLGDKGRDMLLRELTKRIIVSKTNNL